MRNSRLHAFLGYGCRVENGSMLCVTFQTGYLCFY